MRAVRQRDTKAELAIRQRLHAKCLRYRVDRTVLDKPRRRADIAFTRLKIAVFVDGCFWHGCPEHGTSSKENAEFWRDKIETNVRRDRDTHERLRAANWVVHRYWEHEDPNDAADTIARMVHRRASQL
ncbi:MAG: DNA mismatch endonuclease Vsr [Proteobacteria bacterium]|nr:MAG: DNA mismatch endonuclease Vsr [Pseudomonadota bacterium]